MKILQNIKVNAIALLLFLAVIPNVANAQSKDFTLGAILAYGTEIENLGIGANAEFPVMEKLTISPSFIYYLPKSYGSIKTNWFEVNANANYYFVEDDKFDFYGLAGLNYSSVSVKYDGIYAGIVGNNSASDGRFGLNIGGGANWNLGSSITPFAELKYVIIDGGQLVLAAGVRFKI